MANVAGVLKSEISRISRKEVKAAVKRILKSNVTLKKTVVDLNRRVTRLERDNKSLKAIQAKQQAATPPIVVEDDKRARLTSKGVRRIRNRLGLSRLDFAKLLGTTAYSVYIWENKEGSLKLRGSSKAALLSVRRLGAREAKLRLAEGKGNNSSSGRSVNRNRKRDI